MRKNILNMGKVFFALLWLGVASDGLANAVSITNLSVASTSGGTADIQFDISWSNSWFLTWSDDGGATAVTNWDAAWIFLKFKTADGYWRHGMLASSGHTAPAGTIIEIGPSGTGTNVGAFIRRDAVGSGPLSVQGVRLRWDFAQSSLGGTSDVDISIHAIEMVYIPKGSFALGSGGAENNHFYKYPSSTEPYWVTNEAAISMGGSAGWLNPGSGIISNIFPKGYAPFYCMKYEISQGQYAAFLNHLAPWEANLRYPDYYGSLRYSISNTTSSFISTAPDRACNYLSVIDLCAYLDWSGLRPMTELEYEKTCRGTMPPEPNEYPWGTTTINALTSFNGVDGSGVETALPVQANCRYTTASGGGPIRTGIFAETGSGRQKSGSGYYGVMDLAGNVSECTVTASHGIGPSFIPDHGDGSITFSPDGWPPYNGFDRRGGSWAETTYLATSARRYSESESTRRSDYGGRGVRTVIP